MPNRLDIPQDLNPLIEKREGPDRRDDEASDQPTQPDAASSVEQPDPTNSKPEEEESERRSGEERRS